MTNIVKTLNCKHCDAVYFAFTLPELEAYNKLLITQRLLFDKTALDNHKKVCFNKSLYMMGTK